MPRPHGGPATFTRPRGIAVDSESRNMILASPTEALCDERTGVIQYEVSTKFLPIPRIVLKCEFRRVVESGQSKPKIIVLRQLASKATGLFA